LHPYADKNITLANGATLRIDQVVREVPNKRLVCMGFWQNQSVFAKIFLGEKYAIYAQRDARGIAALKQAGIATPTLLLSTQSPEINATILLIQAHLEAENIESLMASGDANVRFELATKVIEAVASHHRANLIQTDLYFKNFLLDGEEVLTIDGDGIRYFDKLSHAKATENLSILISKLDVLEVESWLPKLLLSYQHVNDSLNLNADQVRRQVNACRIKAVNRYADEKVFRQCTDVNVTNGKHAFTATASQFTMVPTSAQLDQLIVPNSIIKDGNTCTVALVNIANQPVVIKRYNIKSAMHKASRMWRPSRAADSWANAHRLQLLAIPTPEPMALIETRRFGLRGKAYFLSAYVEAPDIAEFFVQNRDKTQRAEFVKQTVKLFYRLYLLKISHGDMKATNIKVVQNKPMLIDLDSMKQHKMHKNAQKSHIKDLKRFMRNWKQDASLYNAFLKSFKVVYSDHQVLQEANLI
jgi:tRNA A-37 threonylcarbamoyl transferase component Bud32